MQNQEVMAAAVQMQTCVGDVAANIAMAERMATDAFEKGAHVVGLPGFMCVMRGRRDRQNLADRLDAIHVTMLINKANHHFGRRSSSACAKYAEASRRISLVRRNSRASRSNSFTRCPLGT